jgi:hypothetical protein
LCARSTRPFAWLELAQMMSMFSACRYREKGNYDDVPAPITQMVAQ